MKMNRFLSEDSFINILIKNNLLLLWPLFIILLNNFVVLSECLIADLWYGFFSSVFTLSSTYRLTSILEFVSVFLTAQSVDLSWPSNIEFYWNFFRALSSLILGRALLFLIVLY